METKHLDNLINDLETLKSRNWLSELGQETLNEYKAIKQALSQHDVIKSVCEHKRIRENIAGGRYDECLDCGKTWG